MKLQNHNLLKFFFICTTLVLASNSFAANKYCSKKINQDFLDFARKKNIKEKLQVITVKKLTEPSPKELKKIKKGHFIVFREISGTVINVASKDKSFIFHKDYDREKVNKKNIFSDKYECNPRNSAQTLNLKKQKTTPSFSTPNSASA